LAEFKDSGREFHISKPRVAGLFALVPSFLIYCAFASSGHEILGKVACAVTYTILMMAYLLRTNLKGLAGRLRRTPKNDR